MSLQPLLPVQRRIDHARTLPLQSYIGGYLEQEVFLQCCRDCPRFGRYWACPPLPTTPQEYLRPYSAITIYITQIFPPREIVMGTPIPDQGKVGMAYLEQLRRSVDPYLLHLEQVHPGSRAFFAGSCNLCRARGEDECPRIQDAPCRHPDRMRYSLESLGFNLATTAKKLMGVPMCWPSGGHLPRYYTLVSALARP